MISVSRSFDRSVIPQFYAERYPQFVAIIEAYYKWVDSLQLNTVELNRNIDSVSDDFIDALVDEIASQFPYKSTDKKAIGRFARQVFRARGTRLGIEQLFRLMYGVDAGVSYPGDKSFTPSADKYSTITQIQVTNDSQIAKFLNKRVYTSSGGEFVVRSVKTVSEGSRRFTVVEITDVIQPINIGDVVGTTGATVVGSAGSLIINNALYRVERHQPVTIIGDSGGIAKGVITATANQGHELVTNILSGGGGYTTTPEYTVSDTIVHTPTANLTAFDIGTTVSQLQYHITPANGEFVVPVGANVTLIQVDGGNTTINSVTTPVVAVVDSVESAGALVITPSSPPSANIVASTFVTYGSNTVAANVLNRTATGKLVGQRGQDVGIANTTNKFLVGLPITGATANIINDSVGVIESTTVSVTSLGSTFNSLVVEPFDQKFENASRYSVTYGSDEYRSATVGTIDQVVISCSSDTLNPIISISQPMMIGPNTSYTFNVTAGDRFIGGETVVHSSNTNMLALEIGARVVEFSAGDIVCSPSIGSPSFVAIVRMVDGSNVYVGDIQGTIDSGDLLVNGRTNKNAEVLTKSTNYSPLMITGIGRITSIVGNTITVRTTGGLFVNGGQIYGRVSTHVDTISSVVGSSTETFGDNFNIEISNEFDQPLATAIKITDPGVGFTRNDHCTVYDAEGTPVATGVVVATAVTTLADHQGFVRSGISQDSYIQDNDYYQTHSYEIKTPMSFDMYSNDIKRFAHVSGTKMFGSVLMSALFDHSATSTSEITETP